jgi:hypothetical protein
MTRLRQFRGDRNECNFRATIDAMQPWDREQDSHARVVASSRFPVKPVQKQDEKNWPAQCRSVARLLLLDGLLPRAILKMPEGQLVGTGSSMAWRQRAVFVVIGRNEGARLVACLKSIKSLSDQLVYADSCSNDGSPGVAKSLGAIVVSISSPPYNAARGRNEGLSAAVAHFPDCEFVQFLDGDCILQPDWPKAAIDFLDANPEVSAVCGRRFEAFPDASIYNHLADLEWNTPVGRSRACGGDSMMRVSAVLSAGSFDPELMAGEEPELCSRLRAHGWDIWRLGELMTEHDAAIFHFGQWWRRTVRSGFGYAQTWLKTRSSPEPLGAPQLRSALLWGVLFPSLALAAALLLANVGYLLLLPSAYALQMARIGLRTQGCFRVRFASGALLMLAKIAELLGALRCLTSRSYKHSIEYKHPRF